ncbi:MAG TPA: DUF4149 domain-containing protein [Tepidisphaeraceae bacterium]|jgi:lysylphosphatidylglycerol synthetase-like protein (DUF2156 family)
MRRFISTLVTLVWGLWFGGLITLFIAVLSLFSTFPRETAGQGAAKIFHAFNAYQLALAALALIATFVWRLVGPPKRTTAMFAFFAVATIGACLVTMYFTPRIEMLQHQGLANSDQFRQLHGHSMIVYCGEVVALLIAGLIIPWTRDSRS